MNGSVFIEELGASRNLTSLEEQLKVDGFMEDLVILFSIVLVILFLIFLLLIQITQEGLRASMTEGQQNNKNCSSYGQQDNENCSSYGQNSARSL